MLILQGDRSKQCVRQSIRQCHAQAHTHWHPPTHTGAHILAVQLTCVCMYARSRYSPMVDINVDVNASSENRNNMHVFPTPESPISKSLKSRS